MKKRKKSFPAKPTLLLAAAGVLLLGSTIGSTRAALTYYSENYSAQMNMSSIGVTLLENGTAVGHRDYTADGTWDEAEGTEALLTNMLGEGEKLVPGKTYTEKLTVQNSGNIDTFVRLIVTKSWQNDAGKNTELSPELIELNLTDGSGWVEDESESTAERVVLYYTNAIAAGELTKAAIDGIRIDNQIADKVTKVVDGNTIRYVYDYDGYTFNLEAEADAVQTHNAADAIKSAWGVDVSVSADETSFSLLQ